MQLQRAQKIRLGIFLLASLGLLLGCVITLLGLRIGRPHPLFRTRFHESIAGLERNAAVRYQGLRIGHVEDMYVAPDDAGAIEVVLALDVGRVLYDGTTAQLDMSGLTGLKNIDLRPGERQGAALAPGTLLPSAPSTLGKLADNASAILTDMRRIADQMADFINPNNTHQLTHLVSGVDALVGHVDVFLTGERTHLSETLSEAQQMTHAVRMAAQETTATVKAARGSLDVLQKELQATLSAVRGTVSGVTGQQVEHTLVAVAGAAEQMRARLGQAEVGASIGAFNETMGRVDNLVRDVDLAVRAGREDFSKSLSYLRQAAEDFREFSRILASNPSALVRGHGEEP